MLMTKIKMLLKQPYSSWILNETTCQWEALTEAEAANDGKSYFWNEETTSWEEK